MIQIKENYLQKTRYFSTLFMGAKEKIRQYLEFKGITAYKFEKKSQLSNGILKVGSHFRSDQLKQIRDSFPDLNMNWLLFDEGEMIITPESNQKTNEQFSNELSMLGMDSKINKLQKEFDTFKDAFFKVIEEKLDEAIKNREI